jgi:hypothetical protein
MYLPLFSFAEEFAAIVVFSIDVFEVYLSKFLCLIAVSACMASEIIWINLIDDD